MKKTWSFLPKPKNVEFRTGTFNATRDTVVTYTHEALAGEARRLASLLALRRVQPAPGPGFGLRAATPATSNFQARPALASHEQAYHLEIAPGQLFINAHQPAGIYYGIQTLAQLQDQGRNRRRLPAVAIDDHPDLKLRGAQVCYHMIREDMPHSAFNFKALLQAIERFGHYKLNWLLLEFESLFPYRKYPELACKLAFTPDQIRQIAACCQAHHIRLVPLLQSHGHMDYILRHDRFKHLREVPSRWEQICACNDAAKQLYFELLDEMVALLPETKELHVGGDEIGHLGSCPACAEKARKEGISGLLVDHVNAIAAGVKARGLTPIIWSDYFESSGRGIERLDHAVQIMYWNYQMDQWRPWAADFFVRNGLTVIGASGVRAGGANAFANDYTRHFPTLFNLPRALKQLNSPRVAGVVGTNWPKGGSPQLSWYGFAAHAEACWSDAGPDQFNRDFARVHFGLEQPDITRVYDLLSLPDKNPYAVVFGYGPQGRFDLSGMPLEKQIGVYADEAQRRIVFPIIKSHERTIARALALIAGARRRARWNRRELDLLRAAAEGLRFKTRQTRLIDALVQLSRHRDQITPAALTQMRARIRAFLAEARRLSRTTRQLHEPDGFKPSVQLYTDLVFGAELPGWLGRMARHLQTLMRHHESYVSNVVSAREAEVHYLASQGSPYERGLQQAHKFHALLCRRLANGREYLQAGLKNIAALRQAEGYLRDRFPDLHAELRGLADGLGISLDEMIVYQNWLDCFPAGQCSSVAFSGNEILLGKTQDIGPQERALTLLNDITTDKGVRIINLGIVGSVWGCAGMNSHGLAVGSNSAPKSRAEPTIGLFVQFAVYQLLLGCRTTDEVIAALRQTPWMGKGLNLVCADANGHLAAIGKLKDQMDVEEKFVGWLYRTNHYLAEPLSADSQQRANDERPEWQSTVGRMQSLARATTGKSYCDTGAMQAVLATHVNMPYFGCFGSVCRHQEAGASTLWSLVADVKQRRLLFSGTFPCEKNYKEIRL